MQMPGRRERTVAGKRRLRSFRLPDRHPAGAYRNLYHRAMKTTLDINDQLLANAKVLAVRQRTSLTRLIEEGLRMRLRAQEARQRGKVRLPVLEGQGGLVAGVDPLSNKVMWEVLGDDA